MKRKISLVLSLLFILALVVALVSCGGDEETPSGHEHSFKAEWTNDGTDHWHVCGGEGCTEVSDKAAHTFVEKSKTESTCAQKGTLVEACSTCGYEKTTELPLVAHDYADATCTAPKTCKVCSATEGEANGHNGGTATCAAKAVCAACGEEYGDLLAHSYSETYSYAEDGHWTACTECGDIKDKEAHTPDYEEATEEHGIKCTTCGYVIELPLNHEHAAAETFEAKAATCTEAGNVAYYLCSCGNYYFDEACTERISDLNSVAVKATGHNGGTATCTEKAVCEACGEAYGELAAHSYSTTYSSDADNHWYACVNCGAEKDKAAHTKDYEEATEEHGVKCVACGYVIADQLNHTHVAKTTVEAVAPTCTEDGNVKYYVCACGSNFSDEACTTPIADVTDKATGHAEQYEVIAPTCTEAGITNVTCANCDYTGTKDAKDALGHDEQYQVVAPTCTEAGITNVTCSRCDYTSTKDPVAAAGHAEQYDVIPPTCTSSGITIVTCSNCNYTTTKNPVNALGHTWKDATCVTPKTCETCGATEGEALGHEWVDADCVTPKTCSVCEETEGDPLGHDWVDADCVTPKTCSVCKVTDGDPLGHDEQYDVIDPTCTTDGITNITCSRCDYTNTKDPKEALGHDWADATCVTPKTCSRCKVTDGEAHGKHEYDVVVIVVDPTCTAEGYTTYGCSAGECGLTEDRDYTIRTPHAFDAITVDGRIVCVVCSTQYRDVTTQISSETKAICLGCDQAECVCGTTVEVNGYISPKAPYALTANEKFELSKVEWADLEKTVDLAIGNGIIVLDGTADTTYTVVVYDANGVVGTITASGANAQVNLYKYESVVKVEITATTDATASIYSILG